jgi:cytochrome c553
MQRLGLTALAGVFLLAGVAEAAEPPPGASSCTGCHAPMKVSDSVIPHIAGRKESDIATAMFEYRSGAWPSSVMGRIAKGFDDAQINAIAAWFAAQPE